MISIITLVDVIRVPVCIEIVKVDYYDYFDDEEPQEFLVFVGQRNGLPTLSWTQVVLKCDVLCL